VAIDRSKGRTHENDHAHRHERDFRVVARRNKLLGLWAAEKLGLHGEDAERYAKQVVVADLDEPGDEDVIRKVLGDFGEHRVSVTREELVSKLNALLVEAVAHH
jgi:hypothetical protein